MPGPGHTQRDAIANFAPPWLGVGTGERYVYMLGLALDLLDEKMNQAMLMHLPTYAHPTALPFIGSDRLLVQGPNEPNASFAQRLRVAFDDYSHWGAARATLRQMLSYALPVKMRGRVITNSSVWWTYEFGADTTQPPWRYQFTPSSAWVWNWDGGFFSAANVNARNWWRNWIVVYPVAATSLSVSAASNATPIQITTTTPHGLNSNNMVAIADVGGNTAANGLWVITKVDASNFTLNNSVGNGAYTSGGTVEANWTPWAPEGYWDDGQTWDDGGSWDTTMSPGDASALQALARQWKDAGSWVVAIIVSWSSKWFDPAQPSDNPSGMWGTWAIPNNIVTNQAWVPARYSGASYLDGVT